MLSFLLGKRKINFTLSEFAPTSTQLPSKKDNIVGAYSEEARFRVTMVVMEIFTWRGHMIINVDAVKSSDFYIYVTQIM